MLGILFGAALAPSAAQEGGKKSNISTLEGLTGQLSELRLQIATERREWKVEQPHLLREIQLLQAEKEQLETELEEYRQEQSTRAEDRAELLKRRKQLQSAIAELKKGLRRAEINLVDLYARIPQPLLGNLEAAFEELPATDEAAEKKSVAKRLQKVLALYSGVQKLQHEVRSARALVQLEDSRREMDVLYIGLARAFAVSADGQVGAVGELAGDEWQWRRNDAIAPPIQKAIRVFKREEPASLVSLPLEAEGGVE